MVPCLLFMVVLSPWGWAIRQPPDTVVSQGQPLTLNCSLSTTQITTMYWYKQAVGKDARLQLVLFSTEGSSANVEKPFEGHFQSSGTKNNVLSLSAERAQVQDSGIYYCAKQDHTVTQLPKVLSINLPAKGKDFPSPTRTHTFASCIRNTPSCSNSFISTPLISLSILLTCLLSPVFQHLSSIPPYLFYIFLYFSVPLSFSSLFTLTEFFRPSFLYSILLLFMSLLSSSLSLLILFSILPSPFSVP
ncbi:unnamed protein product [Eretmochelys imbricata]